MIKHLNETNVASGLYALINQERAHDTDLKQFTMRLAKEADRINLSFELNFMT